MAEYAVFPLNVKLHLHRNITKEHIFVPTSTHIPIQRKCYSGSRKSIQFSSWNANKVASHLRSVRIRLPAENFVKCCCFGTLVNADSVIISDWIPIVDQVLLMTSIFLTYTAGVIPARKPLKNDCKDDSNGYAVPKNTSHSGSCSPQENVREIDIQVVWDKVKVKLLDSLDAMKQDGNCGIRVGKFQKEFALRPSSLFALSEFPRLRLLWTSFLWLKKEVDDVFGKSHIVSNNESSAVFTCIIQKSCQSLCMAWLEEELCLKNSRPDKVLLSSMIDKLSGYNSILQCVRQTGKEDLYAELICALGSGSVRMNGYYDHSLFTDHGVSILEDLVITLADGVASMYLELISVDSSMSNEMNSLGLNLCTMSTRALQRLRNEVALHKWLHQNMESVVSMYEDRFELHTFESRVIEKSGKTEAENHNWWKRLSMRRSGSTLPALSVVVITPFSVPVKRTKELRALTGWKYYFSLFLELADIAMPLVRTVIAKISDAISFFLVCLIGRSLGLIYTGIRQSLRWK